MLLNFFFNFFASIVLISVCMSIFVSNAIYAVLFLILAFFSSMNLLFLLKVDYLALVLILIYVGAIAILFLFVVMMLKVNIFNNINIKLNIFSILNIIITIIIIYCFIIKLYNNMLHIYINDNSIIIYKDWFKSIYFIDNIKMIGQVLYNYFIFHFILMGFVLLIGIIGSILLSKECSKNIRRHQLIFQQISREVSNSIFLIH